MSFEESQQFSPDQTQQLNNDKNLQDEVQDDNDVIIDEQEASLETEGTKKD